MISKQDYQKHIGGFAIVDCTIRSKDVFYFVAREIGSNAHPVMSEPLAKKRVISCMLDEPIIEQWGNVQLLGMEKIFASSSKKPFNQFVGIAADGSVHVLGSGQNMLEDTIQSGPTGPIRGGVRRARQIDGFTYVASGRRGLAKRVGTNQWESFCPKLSIKPKSVSHEYNLTKTWGFDDVDGFSGDDIYAAGGSGDVWHWNGNDWIQINIGTNVLIESVCCADDGNVYIGVQSGGIVRGRDDTWKQIVFGELNLPFKDLIWYEDRLYGTNDYGLWYLDENHMLPVDLQQDIKVCVGNLATADGVMLLAGPSGAAYKAEGKWHHLIDVYKAENKN